MRQALSGVIVGQDALLDRLVIGLLADGHVLEAGLPGLAKTTAVKTLAAAIHGSFRRIQFTPDLLPGDLTGTYVYHDGQFEFIEGPLFHESILADGRPSQGAGRAAGSAAGSFPAARGAGLPR